MLRERFDWSSKNGVDEARKPTLFQDEQRLQFLSLDADKRLLALGSGGPFSPAAQ